MNQTIQTVLQSEDRAVSPVIGVILMVAITVILAAVIGTFVLGLGDQVQDTAPTAQISFSQEAADNSGQLVTISHDSGETLDADNIEVQAAAETESVATGEVDAWATNGEVTAGSSVSIGDSNGDWEKELTEGDTVAVVWVSDDGSTSDTLQDYEVN